MPLPGFEPRSPRPQSISDDLDRSAMGPAFPIYYFLLSNFFKLYYLEASGVNNIEVIVSAIKLPVQKINHLVSI